MTASVVRRLAAFLSLMMAASATALVGSAGPAFAEDEDITQSCAVVIAKSGKRPNKGCAQPIGPKERKCYEGAVTGGAPGAILGNGPGAVVGMGVGCAKGIYDAATADGGSTKDAGKAK